MTATRTRITAQDRAIKAIQIAASAEPNQAVAAALREIAAQLAKRWGAEVPS